jgi:hypothetical protein
MGKKDTGKIVKPASLRVHKHLFMLNDLENKALERYLRKYRVQNKSKFIRETLMMAILRRFEEDAPTLFD